MRRVGVPPKPRRKVVSPVPSSTATGSPPEPFHHTRLPLSNKTFDAIVEVPLPEIAKRDVVAVPPTVALSAERFVLDAVVAKKLVVVAAVPVALRNVKFCKVELAVARIFSSVVIFENVLVPVKELLLDRSVEEANVHVEVAKV